MDRKQLNQATAENPAPPPGYIYTEVAKWSHNNPSVNRKLETYLVNRLKKSNPFVKWKVLLIIKHVCPKANVGFKRAMQRHTDTIKACMQFRGPPHATLGDTPYENVRNEARAAVEAIFADVQQQKQVASGLSNRIQGQGSGGGGGGGSGAAGGDEHAAFQGGGRYDTGAGGRAGGSGRYNSGSSGSGAAQMGAPGTASAGSYRGTAGRAMGGHGNPNFKDPRNKKPGLFDKMRSAVQSATSSGGASGGGNRPQFMNQPTGAAGYNYASNRGPNAVGGAGSGGTGRYGAPASSASAAASSVGYGNNNGANSPARRNSKTRSRGGVGGGWGNGNDDDIKLNAATNNNRGNAAASAGMNRSNDSVQGQAASNIGRAGGAVGDGKYETQLVDNICSPGGLRPRPATADVKAFIQRCKTLNAETIASVLVDRVCDEDWTVQAKALVVINALANDPSCSAHADYFYDNKDVFEEEMEASEQKMIRDRARTVLKTLGVEGLGDSAAGDKKKGQRARKAATLPEIQAPDPMFDMSGGGEDSSANGAVGAAASGPASNPADDLLGMFGSGTAVSATVNASASSPPAPSVAVEADLTAPEVASPAAVAAAPNMFDGLMSGTPESAAPAAPDTATTGSILDSFMSAPTQAATSSVSEATFGDGGSLLSPTKAPAVPPAVPTQATMGITDAFASLGGLGGATNNAGSMHSGGPSLGDPLSGLSGIASRPQGKNKAGGLLNLDFSAKGMQAASAQQKQNQGMQQILMAQQQQQQRQQQQRQQMIQQQQQQRGAMMMPGMSMAGMGGVRAMPAMGGTSATPLPDFNASGGGTSGAVQAQTTKKTSAAFGFVNDLLQ
jgi:hypothetical protein